jgi:hypothetical protein
VEEVAAIGNRVVRNLWVPVFGDPRRRWARKVEVEDCGEVEA